MEAKNTKNPLQCLNLMVSEPFFFSHFLAFFSYLVIRISTSDALSSDLSDRLLRREIQAVLALMVLIVVKLVKEETWEGFVVDSLFFAKVFLFLVASVIDYHLALCYAVGFLVIKITTWYSSIAFSGDSSKLTPLQLEVLLTEGSASRFWLVEFQSFCSSTCIRTSRFLPDLSITYSNKNLSFGIVDLSLFPNVAEKFGISMGVSMNQLPTYILFDNGTEVARFPDVQLEEKASYHPITKGFLCRYFELDRRLIEYVYGK
ncbi:hypothetical protein Scep_008082 [Stephania cephalantha]|uniref:Thioredoxin-related transmembrane protein 2 n=1 Tax=Stephania cephalantha TaxID=152367 RepID=A0AAP0KDS0_9MAGN